MRTIRKVALAVFKDRKVMMVRSRQNESVFYTLGGKIEDGESDEDCLLREVKEEINCTIGPELPTFLHEFETVAHGHENVMLNIRLYSGELLGKPHPSSEIVEIAYFDSTAEENHITIMGKAIVDWLKENNYID